MRSFLRQMLASALGSFLGLLVFSGLAIAVPLLALVALSLGRDPEPAVRDRSVLAFDLATPIRDANPILQGRDALNELLSGDRTTALTLRSVIDALDRAATDERITGLYLYSSDLISPDATGGWATLRELRQALLRFRASGKPMIAYDDSWDERDYYLTSVAPETFLNPFGLLEFNGFNSETAFFGDALDKYGVQVQVVRAGRYKSAVEPFVQNQRSPQSRQQLQQLLNRLWTEVVTAVAESREVSAGQLQAIADRGGQLRADEAAAAKLIDRPAYLDEVITRLQDIAAPDEDSETRFRQVSLSAYVRATDDPTQTADRIQKNPTAPEADPAASPSPTAKLGTIAASRLAATWAWAIARPTDLLDRSAPPNVMRVAMAQAIAARRPHDPSGGSLSQAPSATPPKPTNPAESPESPKSTQPAPPPPATPEASPSPSDSVSPASPPPADQSKPAANQVAVLYAEGAIVNGRGQAQQIGGDHLAEELRKLRLDERVAAIVLRVNSPGGSASASEVIQREVKLARAVKPVIVSMGDYAASGGYWISTYATRIFAEPTTITGSIGVFGLLPNVETLGRNNGVNWDAVKTAPFADLGTLYRRKTAPELAIYQDSVNWVYDQFLQRVAESRQLDRAAVERIAEGRVWSGSDAVEIGLVDELGGLDAAIAAAAAAAKLGDTWEVQEYPERSPLTWLGADWLSQGSMITGGVGAKDAAITGPLSRAIAHWQTDLAWWDSLNDPQGIYAKLPYRLTIR